MLCSLDHSDNEYYDIFKSYLYKMLICLMFFDNKLFDYIVDIHVPVTRVGIHA